MIMLTTAHIAATASYKAFFLQARVSVIAGLLAMGIQIWLIMDCIRFWNDMTFSISVLFPLVAAFLDFVSAKKSMVDEMTVQAVRGIRKNRKKK